MSRMQRILFWAGIAAVFVILLHLLRDVLLPFVAGMAVAYFLDPVADKLEEKGCSRLIATLIISIAFFACAATVFAMLFPLLQGQIIAIAERVPALIGLIESIARDARQFIEGVLPPDAMQRAGETASNFSGTLAGWLKTIVGKLVSGGSAFIELLSLIILTPVVSFYMLLEWDRIVEKLDRLLPRKQAPTIRRQLGLMDQTISAFVRGQATVCLVLATYYAIALSALGLETGLLIGIVAGLISFVPYVGAMTGIAIGVGVGIVQFSAVLPVLGIAAIFIVGQLCESYVLTPRLVGDRVGLHDLWIIFALMAGGTLFGFVGVLLAVPVAAIIGVLARFTTGCYLDSALYHGDEEHDS